MKESKRLKSKVERVGMLTGFSGHDLLGAHKKILVLGAANIGDDKLQAIARNDFGFEKKDFVFVIDYTKIVNAAGRLDDFEKYDAVICGKMPHKVCKLGDWSSLIVKFAQEVFGPYAIEAQNNAGELIINKESFREALADICEHLRVKKVA